MARCRLYLLSIALAAGAASAQVTSPGVAVPGAGATRPAPKPAAPSAPARPSQSTVPLDRVIAVVNDEALTQYELDEMKRIVLSQMRASNVRPPPADALDTQVLERLLVDRA